ncbi:MAG TPA: L-2-hydroxyglutarate oxidase [Gemmatimonadales bacterium]|nr:L-2-hydroxyglutarate oxidase [Gemmatimonadales bacterium]
MSTGVELMRPARRRGDTGLPRCTDFLVVGGGIVGITLALQLKRRHPDSRVTLIEKEAGCGLHASGRNSGVLHAGFYYTADSLKARFTRDGNRQLTAYCLEQGLRVNRCGKLVVAKTPADLPGLAELLRRGRAGGIPLEEVSVEEARRIEPRVKTCERALFSPSTSSVDPAAVVASLERDLRSQGITVVTGTAYLGRSGTEVRTSAGTVASGYVVNAAGLYADRVARDYGFGERYQILPFKGLYLRAARGSPGFRTHIYPVPDLKAPFLGVHVTVTADGAVKIGPTAVPALWREHYHGVRSFSLAECVATLSLEAGLFLRNEVDFRRLAVRELRKCSRRALAALASELAEGIRPEDYLQWGRPGIRAQLFDLKERKLEMDFRFEGDDRSFHVLNAVSPAFTCALPFSAYLVDQIEQLAG